MDIILYCRSSSAFRFALTVTVIVSLLSPLFGVATVIPIRDAAQVLRWVGPFVLGGSVLIFSVISRSLPRRFQTSDGIACAFIGVAIFSTLYSFDPMTTFLKALSLVLFYGAVFWGFWLYIDICGVEKLAQWMVAAVAIAVVSHVVFFVLYPAGSMYNNTERFVGFAENPGGVGALVAQAMPLALWYAFSVRRWHVWSLIGVMLLLVIVAQTRLEVLSMVIGSGLFLLCRFPHRRIVVLISITGYIGAFMWWSFVSPSLYDRYVDARLIEPVADASLVVEGQIVDRDTEEQEAFDTLEIRAIERDLEKLKTLLGSLDEEPLQFGSQAQSEKNELLIEIDKLEKQVEVAISKLPSSSDDLETTEFIVPPRYTYAQTSTLGWRSYKWQKGLSYLAQRPLLGFGFGTEDQLFTFHGLDWWEWGYTGGYMHNSYLGMALQLGLFGFLLFFCPILFLLARELRPSLLHAQPSVRLAIWCVCLSGLFSALLSSWVYAMGNPQSLQFWICIMLLVYFGSQQKVMSEPGQEAVRDPII